MTLSQTPSAKQMHSILDATFLYKYVDIDAVLLPALVIRPTLKFDV